MAVASHLDEKSGWSVLELRSVRRSALAHIFDVIKSSRIALGSFEANGLAALILATAAAFLLIKYGKNLINKFSLKNEKG